MSERPQWFEEWVAEQPPVNRALGTSFKRPTRSLTIPSNAGPGDARIVIGTDLPPPLDTYVVQPFNRQFAAAIIFYSGTFGDDDYSFIGNINAGGPFVGLYIGAVINGVIIEREIGTGFPSGIVMEATTTADIFTTIGTSDGNFGPGTAGLAIGSKGAQDGKLVPARSMDQDSTFSPAVLRTTTSAVFVFVIDSTTCFVVKRYSGSIGGGTGFRVTVNGSIHLTGGTTSTGAEFAVEISQGATVFGQYPIGKVFCNLTNDHNPFSMFANFVDPANFTASSPTFSFRLMWRRYLGTGTLGMNADDYYSWCVEEAPVN